MNVHLASLLRGATALGIAAASATAVLAATPAEMKAIVQTGNGGPEVLHYESVPVRQPAEGQVLIRVYAAAVNPVDWKMRNGMGRPPGDAPSGDGPVRSIPGMDVAGVVELVGAGVSNVRVGDAVFSMLGRRISGLNGGYAQFALAPSANVVAKPGNLTYAEAAGLGTVGMTGWRVINQTKVTKGQRVLVTGVAGGVGSAAAQIARSRGAYVIGTASARHNEYLKSLGVDEVIDYTRVRFEEQIRNVDVVIDTVGSDTAERSLVTLRQGGTFASVAGRVAAEKCAAAGVTCTGGGPPGTGGPTEGQMLTEVARLAAAGSLAVHIDQRFPLEKAADAQVLSAGGRTQGKIILIVDAAQADKR